MTDKERVKILLGALNATLPYLPYCKGKEGYDCGPKMPYVPRCPYMVARVAIERAEGKVDN